MSVDKNKSQDKGSLLSRWLKRKSNETSETGRQGKVSDIAEKPKNRPALLSNGQERLWFLQQLFPENPFYHYADVYCFKGALDTAILIRSFRFIANRHDILKSTFHFRDNQAVQQVNETLDFDFDHYDLQSTPLEKQENKARDLAKEIARKPFDLKKGPLFRLMLIKMGETDHSIVLTMHHIITDKWSMRILREELAAVYQAYSAGKTPALEPLPIQYADYAYWQRNQKANPENLAYWTKQLSGDLPFLKLPTDRPRPLRPSFDGAYNQQVFSPSLYFKLKALSQAHNTTLFVLLLTVYKILLYRYSGQEDIRIGTPFTNRDKTVLEKLIGFFNDTLVLRSDLSGDPSFSAVLEKVRKNVLEAFAHKNTPFETLVKTLKPERYISSNPFFQTMFLFHSVPEKPTFGSGLELEYEPFDFGVSKFDLTLYFSEEGDQLTATFEYAKDLFEKQTIERMQGHLETLLEAIVQNPEEKISKYPILTEAERHRQLVEWNATEVDLPQVSCIQQFFEEQVLKHPDRVAVVDGNSQLSYRELNEKANAIAIHLQHGGIGPDHAVGLCTKRSVDMITGILGILKAGGAYLPLDPEYPKERLDYMLKNAEVPLILSQTAYADLFSDSQVPLVLLEQIPESKQTLKIPKLNPGHLAYIIYTSGSAGLPKGVPVNHGNLIHSTAARFEYYPDQPGNFLLLSSFAFDSSVVGIFWTICSGGTLVLPEQRIEQDIFRLAAVFEQNQVSHTLLLPSLYTVLLQHAPADQLKSLKTVIVAGEACSTALIDPHFKKLPETRLYNEYGPTEASVWCTVHEITEQDRKGPVPIGRPISNTQNYILNNSLMPVPVGVPGELYVGGAGITKGYIKRPDLTASNFLQNPFGKDSSARMYRTGDLARYRTDGLIEFLGRADDQVKIRGYRIELNEIQEQLRKHEMIREAAIIVENEKVKENPIHVESKIEHIINKMKNMNEGEVEDFLRSVESLSESELDFLLNQSIKSSTEILE